MFLPRGFIASLGMHFAVILLAIIDISKHEKQSITEQVVLPVEIIKIDEFTKLMQRDKVNFVAENNFTHSVNKSQFPSLKKMEGIKKVKFTETVKNPIPYQRPRLSIEKQHLNVQKLKILLDKTPDVLPVEKPQNIQEVEIGELTISEIDAFRMQIRRCWRVPAGARYAETLLIRVKVGLTIDGAIESGPVIINREKLGDRYFKVAAESVLRAIRRCQPFVMPRDKYEIWHDLELNFDPQKMLAK